MGDKRAHHCTLIAVSLPLFLPVVCVCYVCVHHAYVLSKHLSPILTFREKNLTLAQSIAAYQLNVEAMCPSNAANVSQIVEQ